MKLFVLLCATVLVVQGAELRLIEGKHDLTVANGHVSLSMSKEGGEIVGLRHGGRELLDRRRTGYLTLLAGFTSPPDGALQTEKERSTGSVFLRQRDATRENA